MIKKTTGTVPAGGAGAHALTRLAVFLLFLIPFTNHGCSTTPDGPKHLYPRDAGPPGYIQVGGAGGAGVFEGENFRIEARPLRPPIRPGDNAGTTGLPALPTLFGELLAENYVVLKVTIVNRSEEKLLFNPSLVSLMDNEMEYRKPLDYTGIYDIVRKKEGKGPPEVELARLKGKYYDLNETVPPGGKTSKLLIFKPLSERGKRAVLKIKELYIGTEAISLAFPFRMLEEEKGN